MSTPRPFRISTTLAELGPDIGYCRPCPAPILVVWCAPLLQRRRHKAPIDDRAPVASRTRRSLPDRCALHCRIGLPAVNEELVRRTLCSEIGPLCSFSWPHGCRTRQSWMRGARRPRRSPSRGHLGVEAGEQRDDEFEREVSGRAQRRDQCQAQQQAESLAKMLIEILL